MPNTKPREVRRRNPSGYLSGVAARAGRDLAITAVGALAAATTAVAGAVSGAVLGAALGAAQGLARGALARIGRRPAGG